MSTTGGVSRERMPSRAEVGAGPNGATLAAGGEVLAIGPSVPTADLTGDWLVQPARRSSSSSAGFDLADWLGF